MIHKKFCFYFDESFHDRAIKLTANGSVNLFSDGISDTFTGAFIGVDSNKVKDFECAYLKFENKYKKIYGIDSKGEFKGTVIKKKNFEFGISSLNYNATRFYSDFFDILIEYKCIIQLNLFSKIERLLYEVFKEGINSLPYNVSFNSFIYSITKFIFRYRDLGLAEKLLSDNSCMSKKEIFYQIKAGINLILSKVYIIKRKQKEVIALNELLYILNLFENNNTGINLNEKIKWNYDSIFDGFSILINNLNLSTSDIELKLDEENNILDSAKRYYKCLDVDNYNSKNVIGIRCADILANFFGRIIYSIQKELDEPNPLNIKHDLHYISKNWFYIDENKFRLIKNILTLIKDGSIYNSIFFEYSCVMFSYLFYIDEFESFTKYTEHTNYNRSLHYDTGNEYMIYSLNECLSNLI